MSFDATQTNVLYEMHVKKARILLPTRLWSNEMIHKLILFYSRILHSINLVVNREGKLIIYPIHRRKLRRRNNEI